jgi:environmental stress-induced protein Ves
MMFLKFCLKNFFDVFLGKFSFQGVSTWSNFGGCSAEIAPPKNSNTPDLFYSRMDLSIAIIKLGSNFFTFPTIVRTCTILIKNET